MDQVSTPLNVAGHEPFVACPIEQRRLILIEDDDGVRRSLQLLLRWQGYDVRAYASATAMLDDERVAEAQFLIADHRLPGVDGITLLATLRSRGWAGRAVLITGFPSPRLAVEARAVGFSAVLSKPIDQRRLLAILAD